VQVSLRTATLGSVTPAIVALSAAGVAHQVHQFQHDPHTTAHGYGLEAAAALRVMPDRVFKTLLVTVAGGPAHLTHAVGIVPVTCQLSLKAIAAAVGTKRAEMCRPEVAERLTGYVVGGISPLGQKRSLPTAIDETCVLFDTIFVSGGRRGLDIEVAPDDLVRMLDAAVADLAAD
jgi:Cys-tRNA(Pro)/Cys-tRNA(Cys) deacylase